MRNRNFISSNVGLKTKYSVDILFLQVTLQTSYIQNNQCVIIPCIECHDYFYLYLATLLLFQHVISIIYFCLGGTEIRVWDAFYGGKLLTKISQHHKTITSLRLASNGNRLMSASLDQHVKIYDVSSYRSVHTLDYSNGILSLGISVSVAFLFIMSSILFVTVSIIQGNSVSLEWDVLYFVWLMPSERGEMCVLRTQLVSIFMFGVWSSIPSLS